jgi:hypothetical protein
VVLLIATSAGHARVWWWRHWGLVVRAAHRGRAQSDDGEMENGRASTRGRGGAKRSKGAAVDGRNVGEVRRQRTGAQEEHGP